MAADNQYIFHIHSFYCYLFLCTYTTVHFIVGSGYEAGFVARQESDDGGNLFGLSHSTERHALRYHILVGFRGLVRKLGLAVNRGFDGPHAE